MNISIIDTLVDSLKSQLTNNLETTDIMIKNSSSFIVKVPSNESVLKSIIISLNDPRLTPYFESKNTYTVKDSLTYLKKRITGNLKYTPSSSSSPSAAIINTKQLIIDCIDSFNTTEGKQIRDIVFNSNYKVDQGFNNHLLNMFCICIIESTVGLILKTDPLFSEKTILQASSNVSIPSSSTNTNINTTAISKSDGGGMGVIIGVIILVLVILVGGILMFTMGGSGSNTTKVSYETSYVRSLPDTPGSPRSGPTKRGKIDNVSDQDLIKNYQKLAVENKVDKTVLVSYNTKKEEYSTVSKTIKEKEKEKQELKTKIEQLKRERLVVEKNINSKSKSGSSTDIENKKLENLTEQINETQKKYDDLQKQLQPKYLELKDIQIELDTSNDEMLNKISSIEKKESDKIKSIEDKLDDETKALIVHLGKIKGDVNIIYTIIKEVENEGKPDTISKKTDMIKDLALKKFVDYYYDNGYFRSLSLKTGQQAKEEIKKIISNYNNGSFILQFLSLKTEKQKGFVEGLSKRVTECNTLEKSIIEATSLDTLKKALEQYKSSNTCPIKLDKNKACVGLSNIVKNTETKKELDETIKYKNTENICEGESESVFKNIVSTVEGRISTTEQKQKRELDMGIENVSNLSEFITMIEQTDIPKEKYNEINKKLSDLLDSKSTKLIDIILLKKIMTKKSIKIQNTKIDSKIKTELEKPEIVDILLNEDDKIAFTKADYKQKANILRGAILRYINDNKKTGPKLKDEDIQYVVLEEDTLNKIKIKVEAVAAKSSEKKEEKKQSIDKVIQNIPIFYNSLTVEEKDDFIKGEDTVKRKILRGAILRYINKKTGQKNLEEKDITDFVLDEVVDNINKNIIAKEVGKICLYVDGKWKCEKLNKNYNNSIQCENECSNQKKISEEKQRKTEEEKQRKTEEEKQRKTEEEKQRKVEEEKQKKVEEEKQKKVEEEKQKKVEEEKQKKTEEEKQRKTEEEKQKKVEEEKQKKTEEEKQKKAEEEKQKKTEEEKQRKVEEEKQRKTEEEKQRKTEEEKQKKAEEEKQKKVEEEKQKKVEEEKQKKVEEEKQKKVEEEKQKKAEEEKQKKAEEEKQKKAEEDVEKNNLILIKQKQAAEKARREDVEKKARIAADEQVRREKAQKEEENRIEEEKRIDAEKNRIEEEKAKRIAQEKAKRIAEEKRIDAEKNRIDAEKNRIAEEKAKRIAQEKAKRIAEVKAQEEAKRIAQEEAKRIAKAEANKLIKENGWVGKF
jgi:hypothetical protein